MVALRPVLILLMGCAQGQTSSTADPIGETESAQTGTAPDPAPEPFEDETQTATEEVVVDEIVEIDPVKALVRASLDLRGIRPSVTEMEAVESDPEQYASYVDSYLQDDRFGERVRELFSEVYLTQQDYYYVEAADFDLDDEVGFVESVGSEPLHILSHIVENDLPYYEIVTADWTMANEILGQAFPVDYPEDGTGWQQVSYTDGRPMAGILSTNGMWWRYMSTDSNANRGRANAISRILTCHDYLSRPIEFDRNVNLLDDDALNEALQSNPGCVACHNSLDPLASYFYGFYQYLYFSKMELVYYHADREQMWQDVTGVAPGYMGEPGYHLEDLGQQMANDSRLISCITEQVHDLMLQRDNDLDDVETLTTYRDVFLQSDLQVRALFRSVINDEEYTSRLDRDGTERTKMLSPDQYASAVHDITGFRFTYAGYDLMQSDSYGVRTLAGGVDGIYSTRLASEPTATIALVHERISQAAARWAAEHDDDNPDEPYLFTEIDFLETPDTDRDAMVAQLQQMHLRIHGSRVDADGPEIEAHLALWEDLFEVEQDTVASWAGVASVMLRDPDFLFY